jgi:uncharacterized protein YndB with AHSA1/START domain
VTASTVSVHLNVLREAGLVVVRRQGTFRYYRADHDALRGVRDLIAPPGTRWSSERRPADLGRTAYKTRLVAIVTVVVPVRRAAAFDAFADGARFGSWLGVDVSIVDGRFACTTSWGQTVRGTYEIVVPSELIAIGWDFAGSQTVPVPGGQLPGYIRFSSARRGTCVEVQQFVDSAEQAEFMHRAWGYVLSMYKKGVVASAPRRSRR